MTTVRIFFEKCGEAAYISLLDLQRVFHRILKMSDLPVYYTQGYNPHIYLSFSCPLSLGQESLCESCEVKTEQEMIDGEVWKNALQPLMPRGIVITKVAPAVEKVAEIESVLDSALRSTPRWSASCWRSKGSSNSRLPFCTASVEK